MKCPECGSCTSVAETRAMAGGYVAKRTRLCANGHRYITFEVDGGLEGTVVAMATRRERVAQLQGRARRWARNVEIRAASSRGVKHEVLALQYHLAPNMISTIVRGGRQ